MGLARRVRGKPRREVASTHTLYYCKEPLTGSKIHELTASLSK